MDTQEAELEKLEEEEEDPRYEEVTRDEARYEWISASRKLSSLCCCYSDWTLRISSSA